MTWSVSESELDKKIETQRVRDLVRSPVLKFKLLDERVICYLNILIEREREGER